MFSVPRLLRHFIDFVTTLALIFEHCGIILASFFRCRFLNEFISILGCILVCFLEDFLLLFLPSLENVDFIRIAVFLQENNVFHGSEGSKIMYFLLFFEAFLSKNYGIYFSSISGAIWAHFFRPFGIISRYFSGADLLLNL